jgi:hypothetical protein
MSVHEPYWYLASYPKSGNTWCRLFITQLRWLSALDSAQGTGAAKDQDRELQLNLDLAAGSMMSDRDWVDDQLGIDSSDLRWEEIDKVRGRIGHQQVIYAEGPRYFKVHDAFVRPDSDCQPVVPIKDCQGAVVIIRDPADVAVSLSHFFSWDLERCLTYLLDERATLWHSTHRGGHQVPQYLSSWAKHVTSWVDQKLIPVLLLRYEDLLLRPEEEFSLLARFLGLPCEQGLIAATVAKTCFAKLRAKEEEEGGFIERSYRCKRFFRSGRSGEGREMLTSEQLEQLYGAFRETCHRFGYGLTEA